MNGWLVLSVHFLFGKRRKRKELFGKAQNTRTFAVGKDENVPPKSGTNEKPLENAVRKTKNFAKNAKKVEESG